MLIAAKKRSTVGALKKQLKSAFSMKDLGGAEHVLGVRIRRQREQHTLYLSLEKYIQKDLRLQLVVHLCMLWLLLDLILPMQWEL